MKHRAHVASYVEMGPRLLLLAPALSTIPGATTLWIPPPTSEHAWWRSLWGWEPSHTACAPCSLGEWWQTAGSPDIYQCFTYISLTWMVIILTCNCMLPQRGHLWVDVLESAASDIRSTENVQVLKMVLLFYSCALLWKKNILRLFAHLCLCLTLMNTYIF